MALAVGDSEGAMRAFMDSGSWSFPVVMAADQLAAAYEVDAIPTLVLVDSNGEIVKTHVGGMDASDLAKAVKDL